MVAKNKLLIQQVFLRIIPYFSWIHPNIITLFSLFFSAAFFIFLVSHNYFFAFLALLGSTTDALDGAVARYFHKTSQFGALLDSTTDRISDAVIISAFSFAGFVGWQLTLPLIILSFLISYIRARGEYLFQMSLEGIGIMERTERIIGIAVATIALFFYTPSTYTFSFETWIFLLLLVLSVITVMQRLLFLWKRDK